MGLVREAMAYGVEEEVEGIVDKGWGEKRSLTASKEKRPMWGKRRI